jgi:membrane protease YdiL (CAAX protease family)
MSSNPEFPQAAGPVPEGVVLPPGTPAENNGVVSPPENPPFSGWDVTKLGLLLFLVPALIEPFVVLFAQKKFYPQLSFGDVTHKPWVILAPQFAWFAVVAVYLIVSAERRFGQSLWSAMRWNWPERGWFSLVGIGIATLVVLQLLQRVLPTPKQSPFDDFFHRPVDAYAFAVLAIAFGPFMEELFFRGFLYPVLARRWGVFIGVLFTALPFACIHVIEYKSWVPVLIVFVVGVVLTLVRAKRGSVASSFIVHAIYNGIPVLATVIVSGGFRHLEKLKP